MRRIISFTLLVMFAVVSANGQSAKKYYKAGEDFFAVNKFEDAIKQFTKAIELDPDYDRAYIHRALVHERMNNYSTAAEDYERALVFLTKDETVYYAAGNAYFKSEQYGAALAKLNTALTMKSNYLEAYQIRNQVFIALERYDDALDDCKRALKYKENEVNYYYLGQAYEKLEMYDESEAAYKNSIRRNGNVLVAHMALAKLSFLREKYDMSMSSVNQVLRIDPNNKEGLMIRSIIHAKQLNLTKAVDDISVALSKFQKDPELLILRGDFYQALSRHSDAIIDFSNAIESGGEVQADVYYKRAGSFENIRDYESAMKDYNKLLELSKFDGNAQRLLAEAQARMFEINREANKPVVKLIDPTANEDRVIKIPRGVDVISLSGLVEDESEIRLLKVNDFTVQPTKIEEGFEFLASINLRTSDQITVEVTDVYENTETALFNIIRTETDKPKVNIIAPYASDNNLIYLDSDDPVIYVEGQISDDSQIKSIYIDDVSASYVPGDINPIFSARVNVENRNKFSVSVEDAYGNIADVEFTLNRDAGSFADNPMGKTWAIFIENSNYESFASLEGPTKDITLMKTALQKYQVHNFIHKKDMTKQDMERFFSIELRDLLKSNRVTSIMVWYAGH